MIDALKFTAKTIGAVIVVFASLELLGGYTLWRCGVPRSKVIK